MYSKMPTKRKISIFFGFGWPSIPGMAVVIALASSPSSFLLPTETFDVSSYPRKIPSRSDLFLRDVSVHGLFEGCFKWFQLPSTVRLYGSSDRNVSLNLLMSLLTPSIFPFL